MGPYGCSQSEFQYAVMAEPAEMLAVSWLLPEVPSSLHARVAEVGSVMGLLYRRSS